MTEDEMKKRLKAFALRCVKLAASFPRTRLGNVVGYQLTKCAPSAAANYNAACRARSSADFVAKLGIVEEEADESVFWVDFSADAGLTKRNLIEGLLKEGNEILAIVIASRRTASSRQGQSKIKNQKSKMLFCFVPFHS